DRARALRDLRDLRRARDEEAPERAVAGARELARLAREVAGVRTDGFHGARREIELAEARPVVIGEEQLLRGAALHLGGEAHPEFVEGLVLRELQRRELAREIF